MRFNSVAEPGDDEDVALFVLALSDVFLSSSVLLVSIELGS